MIFASDLDRTLIYSKKHTTEDDKILLVEKKEDKEISFITEKSKLLLEEINSRTIFIPVTTRSLEHYKRISLLLELNPKYVIINNGGTILIDNKEDLEWTSIIKTKMKEVKYSYEEIFNLVFSLIPNNEVISYKLYDNLIWAINLEKDCLSEIVEPINNKINIYGWMFCKAGRKLYILPSFITKWNALKYLNDKYFNKEIIACGDSSMDYDMVVNSSIGIIPKHGEISSTNKQNVCITSSEGINAGEEILSKVLYILKHIK